MCHFQSSSPAQIALQMWAGCSNKIQLACEKQKWIIHTVKFSFLNHYLPGVSKWPDTPILKNSAKLKRALSSFKLNVMVVSTPMWSASNSDGSKASSVLTAFFIASVEIKLNEKLCKPYNYFCIPPASVKFLSHTFAGVTVTVISSWFFWKFCRASMRTLLWDKSLFCVLFLL